MDDPFKFVENAIQSIAMFFYSALISIVTVIISPVRGSVWLSVKFQSARARQIGPMTLIFLMLFINTYTKFLLSATDMFTNLMVEAYRTGQLKTELLPSIVSAAVITVILDLVSRIIIVARNYFVRGSWRLTSAKLLRFQYSICIGVIVATITPFLGVFLAMFRLPTLIENNLQNTFVLLGAIAFIPAAFLIGGKFTKF
jgi:hypothetical protein